MLYCVTATLGNLAHTQRLVQALAQSTVLLRMVLVDNGSDDDTVEWARGIGPALQVIANERNLGASMAWNQGIRFALANGADIVLVCGNDTCPLPGTIERLVGLVKDGALFVTGTAIPYDAESAQSIGACGADENLVNAPDFSFFMLTPPVIDFVATWDVQLEINRQVKLRDEKQPANGLIASPWSYGLFDERFVNYFGDNDYHVRCKFAGIPCLRDPGALFRHDCSLTIRTVPEATAANQKQFPLSAEMFRSKWGALPHEMDIQQARPLNVDDEQWLRMNGNRAAQEIPRKQVIEEARAVYQRYGIPMSPGIPGPTNAA